MAEKPEDLNLPTAVVSRLIKEVLPDGINVSKEARAAICKSASVFVLYATSCSNNLAMKHKRKTLTAKDVLEAMEEMEFPTFIEPLKEGLEAFKKEQKGKKDAAELKRKQKENEKRETSEKKKKNSENGDNNDSQESIGNGDTTTEDINKSTDDGSQNDVSMEKDD